MKKKSLVYFFIFWNLICGSSLLQAQQSKETGIKPDTVLLKAGQNEEIIVSGSLMFYDDGGPAKKISPRFNGKITFVPAKAGEVILIRFKTFKTTTNSSLSIYNGNDTLAEHQSGSYFYKNIPPKIVSSSKDGKLCVQFINNATSTYNNDSGWEAEVISIQPQPLKIAEIHCTPIDTTSFLFSNSENHQALHIEVQTIGDTGCIAIDKLSFRILQRQYPGSVASAKTFFLGLHSSFEPETAGEMLFGKVDNISKDTLEIEGKAELNLENTYHFYLVYDIGNALPKDTIVTKLLSLKVKGIEKPLSITSGESSRNFVKSGIHGNFIIGSSSKANFSSVQQAIDSLKNGIDGKVILQIEDGTYDGSIIIPNIPGSSSTNTLSITSLNKNAEKVIFSSQYFWVSSSIYEGLFNLDGANYITLSHLSFQVPAAKQFRSLVYIFHASRHTILSHCRFISDLSTDTYGCTMLKLTANSSDLNQNSDFIQVSDSYFEGGKIGIQIGGSSTVGTPVHQGVEIKKCTLKNQGTKGIYISTAEDIKIADNIIINNATTKSNYQAMDLFRASGLVNINNNQIELDIPYYAYGMYLRPVSGTIENPARIYNNAINFKQVKANSYGIDLNGGDASFPNKFIDFAYNTVRMENQTEVNSCALLFLEKNTFANSLTFTNNLLQNVCGGYVYRIQKDEDLAQSTFENNGVFTSNTTTFAYATKDIASFEEWKTLSKEKQSIVEKANFITPSFCGLKTSGHLRIAKPLSWINFDLLNMERPNNHATIGAYEFDEFLDQKPTMDSLYPILSKTEAHTAKFLVKLKQSGLLYSFISQDSSLSISKDSILKSIPTEIAKNKERDILFENLQAHTTYYAYFLIKNHIDTLSKIIRSAPFTTQYLPSGIATFENLSLAAESFWSGSKPTSVSDFYSGSFGFTNNYNAEYNSWDGFAYSNISLSHYDPSIAYDNQYRSCTGGGAHHSSTFAIGYSFGQAHIGVLNDSNGSKISGCYLSNNTMLYHTALNGDSYVGDPFHQGDFFEVIFTGINQKGDTNKVEYYLADYRSSDSNEHYILNSWEWVDLSSLDTVKDIYVQAHGSRQNQWGETLPSYFCLDDFNANYAIQDSSNINLIPNQTQEIALASLFTLNGKGNLKVEIIEKGNPNIANLSTTEKNLKITSFTRGNTDFIIRGTQNGKSLFLKLKITVETHSTEDIATFEDLNLSPESYWNGSKGSETGSNTFYSGAFSFNNQYTAQYGNWSGFAYSNQSSSDFDPASSITEQYRSAPAGGALNSATFAIGYDAGIYADPAGIRSINAKDQVWKGCYITNSAWLYHSATQGDNYAGKAFSTGDFVKLNIYGVNQKHDTTQIHYYLADCRLEDTNEHYVSKTWEWVDLSPLGKVNQIFFHIESSRNDPAYGNKMPAYFCIDEVNANFIVKKEFSDSINLGETKERTLASLFTSLNDSLAPIHTQVMEMENASNLRVETKGKHLLWKGLQKGENNILIQGTQKGVHEYIRLKVIISDKIAVEESTQACELSFYPVPTKDELFIRTNMGSYRLEVYSMSGKKIMEKQNLHSSLESINVRALAPGNYIVKIISNTQVLTKRFVKIP